MSNKVWEKVFMIFCMVVAKFEKTNLVVFITLVASIRSVVRIVT